MNRDRPELNFFALKTALFLCFLIGGPAAFHALAQQTVTPEEKYTSMITQRSAKIVAALQLADAAKQSKVQAIVVDQYRHLNEVYISRDSAIKMAKSNPDAVAQKTLLATIAGETDAKVNRLHESYFKSLSTQLTAAQIEKIKDGMTYGILPLTYNAYCDELPTLTEPQKKQIYAWLVEAREHAVDAESSEKKHAWFGKYKGRINNYLSKEGYDMKKAAEEWQARIKARNEAKPVNAENKTSN